MMDIEFDPAKAGENLTPRGRRTRIIPPRKAGKAEALAYAKGI